jgi:hypothetical protein
VYQSTCPESLSYVAQELTELYGLKVGNPCGFSESEKNLSSKVWFKSISNIDSKKSNQAKPK